MANLDQIMDYLADHVIQTKSYNQTVNAAANARSYAETSLDLPTGARVISIVLRNTPNADWIIFRSYLQTGDTAVRWYYHNEYNGALSGTLSFDVHYVID